MLTYRPVLQVLINAGQANAATGDQGYQDCLTSAKAVADALGCQPEQVLLESTGQQSVQMQFTRVAGKYQP